MHSIRFAHSPSRSDSSMEITGSMKEQTVLACRRDESIPTDEEVDSVSEKAFISMQSDRRTSSSSLATISTRIIHWATSSSCIDIRFPVRFYPVSTTGLCARCLLNGTTSADMVSRPGVLPTSRNCYILATMDRRQ